MKRKIVLIIAVFCIAGISQLKYTPAAAYGPLDPSANVTEYIMTDNFTVGFDSPLEIEATVQTEVGQAVVEVGQAVVQGIEDAENNFLSFFIILFVLCFAFWQKQVFLYIISVPAALVYGLSLAGQTEEGSALWVLGITIAVIGVYSLFKAVLIGVQTTRRLIGGR